MPFVKKDVEEYYYVRTGNTQSPNTLVFVHGATMTGAGLAPFADQFKDYNCIIVDLPGHGQSVGPSKHSVEDFADGVEYLIKELKKSGEITDHITVVGFSMGGCIAVELGLRKIEGLKRLVILNSGAGLEKYATLVRRYGEMSDDEYKPEDLFEHLFGEYTTQEQKDFSIKFMMDTKAENLIGREDLRVASHYDRQDETSSIDIPVFIVSADQDKLVPVEVSMNLRASVPSSSIMVFPYRGHSVIYEETEHVVKGINHFFNDNP